ncbi:hypothetical protein KIN20_027293, partial [Parelaphostrongylus tenuis]
MATIKMPKNSYCMKYFLNSSDALKILMMFSSYTSLGTSTRSTVQAIELDSIMNVCTTTYL